ncbi:hypothetical protein O181_113222 [Austropuccinia psidii MF-1]|uniref:Uncharacterized protein n=1 Tax=Austropuccinia psidii MF-1 TaxID=1389203 RepID=A0A9Q3K389_9BASI|nr:hypothetical protein [Austropuccinia psidii MF-1]
MESLYQSKGAKMGVMEEGTLQLKNSLCSVSLPNQLAVPLASSFLTRLGSFLNNGITLKGFRGDAKLFGKADFLTLTTQVIKNILIIDTPTVIKVCISVNLDPLMVHQQLGHPNNSVDGKFFANLIFFKVNCICFSIVRSH